MFNSVNETIYQYLINRLQKLVATCAIKGHEVRKRFLREKALTLTSALDAIYLELLKQSVVNRRKWRSRNPVNAAKNKGKTL